MPSDSPDHSELADAFDRKLAQILREGQRVLDPETGEVITVDPSAAMLNVIKGRLRDVGATKSSAPEGSGLRALLQETAKRGFRLTGTDAAVPPPDLEGEDQAS